MKMMRVKQKKSGTGSRASAGSPVPRRPRPPVARNAWPSRPRVLPPLKVVRTTCLEHRRVASSVRPGAVAPSTTRRRPLLMARLARARTTAGDAPRCSAATTSAFLVLLVVELDLPAPFLGWADHRADQFRDDPGPYGRRRTDGRRGLPRRVVGQQLYQVLFPGRRRGSRLAPSDHGWHRNRYADAADSEHSLCVLCHAGVVRPVSSKLQATRRHHAWGVFGHNASCGIVRSTDR